MVESTNLCVSGILCIYEYLVAASTVRGRHRCDPQNPQLTSFQSQCATQEEARGRGTHGPFGALEDLLGLLKGAQLFVALSLQGARPKLLQEPVGTPLPV